MFRRAKLCAYRPARKPLISKKNRQSCMKFAQEHVEGSVGDWSQVLWSDEAKFMLFSTDGIRYIRRPASKIYNVKYQQRTVKHGSVMLGGGFSRDILGPIFRIEGSLTAAKYCDMVEKVMPAHTNDKLGYDLMFTHENNPKRTENLMKAWMKDYNVRVISWPAQSSDLNPIENRWDYIYRKIRDC